ncbi:MAG: hypothetical protein IT318_01565 [Anaerolineales bacterium]|nr:hypothetical protein [Anaerolineales bacterium]
MSGQSVYRLGGLAALLGLILSFGSYALAGLVTVAALLLVVFTCALQRLFKDQAPGLSLATARVCLVEAGGILLTGPQTGALVVVGSWAVYFLPALVFGFVAYRQRPAGLPRALAVCGLVGGAARQQPLPGHDALAERRRHGRP